MQHFLQENYAAYTAVLPAHQLAILSRVREQAFLRFVHNELPTPRTEAWRYTQIQRLNNTHYTLPNPVANISAVNLPEPLVPNRLVFIDGILQPELSHMQDCQCRYTLYSQANEQQAKKIIQTHATVLSRATSTFPDLNFSLSASGIILDIPENIDVGVIELLFYNRATIEPILTQPRISILCGKNSKATFIEHFSGDAKADGLINDVVDIDIQEGASLKHIKLQTESAQTDHLSAIFSTQHQNSHFVSGILSLGGRLVRNEVHTLFAEEGARADLYGLFIAQEKQHKDHYTVIDHAQGHCDSQQLYRGILLDKSRGIFNGKVIVRPDAIKSNAKQASHNLLLSSEAEIDTKPELQIYTDDVQCSHGATVGQLDNQALFYLQARGLTIEQAKNLLMQAFAAEVLFKLDVPSMQHIFNETLLRYLPFSQVDGDD